MKRVFFVSLTQHLPAEAAAQAGSWIRYCSSKKHTRPAYIFLTQYLIIIIAQSLAQSSVAQPSLYKNLSANKSDPIDSLWNLLPIKTYPHAQSNSECRGEPWFRARCAISDTIKNTGHGQGFPSWGPDQRTDIWWKVSFGKNVLVDSITIYIRADFPHDGYWFKGMFNFSDGSKLPFVLDSTARPQSFKFTQRTTNYVLIDSLVWRQPATWCAFTQVQVFGYEGVGILPCVNSGMNRNLDKHTLILAEPGPVLDIKNGAAPASFYSLSGRRMAAAPVLMVKEKFNGTSAH